MSDDLATIIYTERGALALESWDASGVFQVSTPAGALAGIIRQTSEGWRT